MLRAENGKVYEALYPTLYRIAYRITGQRDRAEDICQEAFIKYFERGEALPDLDQTKYWLIRVLRNLALNLEKRRVRENRAYQRFLRAAPQFSESGEAAVLAEETRSLVQSWLEQLP